jgi:hypothetical protein
VPWAETLNSSYGAGLFYCSVQDFGLILQYDTIRVINKLRLVIQERIAYLTPRS